MKNRRVECSTECRNVKTKATTAAGHEKRRRVQRTDQTKEKSKSNTRNQVACVANVPGMNERTFSAISRSMLRSLPSCSRDQQVRNSSLEQDRWLHPPWGDSHVKRTGVLVGKLKRIAKRFQDPVLWAWLRISFFSRKKYQF